MERRARRHRAFRSKDRPAEEASSGFSLSRLPRLRSLRLLPLPLGEGRGEGQVLSLKESPPMWTRMLRTILLLALSATLTSCASRTVGVTRSAPRTAGAESGRPLGLDLYRPEPADNPTVPATVRLGRRLFRDRLLSHDRSLACVDCHRPERAFTDGRAKSIGVYGRRGARSVPTIVNRAGSAGGPSPVSRPRELHRLSRGSQSFGRRLSQHRGFLGTAAV